MGKAVPSIRKYFLVNMITLALVSLLLWGAIWVHGEYAFLKSESESLREKYVGSQQQSIAIQVADIVDYVRYMQSRTEERLKTSIKERVNEACKIALNLHAQQSTHRTQEEIKKMIKDALRPIRFNQGRGYYFAFNMEGIEELFADRPEMEGRDMLSVTGAKGEFVVRDMLEIVKSHGHGFYQYTWTKPLQTGKNFPKIAYVKFFEPYAWVIGTGEYLDEVESQIQEEVLERIVDIRLGEEGYLFGSTFAGEPLFSNGKITRDGKNLWDLTDVNGVKIIQEQQKAAAKPDGGFVYYAWPKLNGARPVPKMAYVRAIPEWQWIIGTGIYLDTIEAEIAHKKELLWDNLLTKIRRSAIGLIFLLILILYWARFFSNRIQKSINTFSDFFRKAATQSIHIDDTSLHYLEFKELARIANAMSNERRLAEEESRRLAEAVEQAFETVIITSPEGRIEYVNPAFEQLTGRSRRETQGLNIQILNTGQHDQALFDELWCIIRSGRRWTGRIQNQGRNGDLYTAECSVTPVYNKEGRIAHFVWMLRDITKELEMEERFRQSERIESVGRLAAGVAHDLNNMLSPVLGYADLLLMDLDPATEAHEQIQVIKQSAERSRDLVQQLLAFGRKQLLQIQDLDLRRVVQDMEKLLRRTVRENIEIKLHLSSEVCKVSADPGQIGQVLLNFAVNAQDAMPKGGVLQISVEPLHLTVVLGSGSEAVGPGDFVLLKVADTGYGMDPEIQRHIFEPFFTTKQELGTGLGLATVYGIVKQHGGSIQVHSAPGRGTRFMVYLPAALQNGSLPESKIGTVVSKHPGGSEVVLVVEDNETVRHMACNILRLHGYSVLSADGGLKALSLLDEYKGPPLQLLLTDVIMPDMDGKTLFEKVLEKQPGIKVLFMSGHAENVLGDHGVLEEGLEFIQKPFSVAVLTQKIRQVLSA